MKLRWLAVLGLALAAPGCYDFHIVGPEDPPALEVPAKVTVTVAYQRPSECVEPRVRCDGPVTFHASWMPLGAPAVLTQTAAHVWSATLTGVPVNYPGNDPYYVYAVDPYLAGTATGGVSADRLTIGGEKIVRFGTTDGTRNQGLIYIDANGKGRTPF